MKNIEKYPNTDAALEAWEAYRSGKGIYTCFNDWLDEEVDEREPTLLEEADAFMLSYLIAPNSNDTRRRANDLSHAIEREKRKPIRNVDRYATAEEAYRAFMEMCSAKGCVDCRFGVCESVNECRFYWLYAEAGKEEK